MPTPAGEQHGKPGKRAELRFAVVVAQLDPSKPAEHQIEAREKHHDERAHVVPIERMLDPFANRRIDAVGEVDKEGCENDEGCNHTLGRYAHAGVQPLPETSASDAFRDLILHRPHPSRSAPIRFRLRRGSGSGRAAKSASLRLPCLATIIRVGQSPSDHQHFRRVRMPQQRRQDHREGETVLFGAKRRCLPPTAMVADVVSACDEQDRRRYEPFSFPRSYGAVTPCGKS